MARPVIILFARAPRLGMVKRRLAASIGDAAALRFYRNQLRRITSTLATLRGFDIYLATTPDRAKFPLPRSFNRIPQGHGELGRRMHNAFRRFPRRRTLLIGADIPGLDAATLRAAARALEHHDAVFGPAADGGYYLAGMGARRPATPFAGARWSSPFALADTAANFSNHRIAYTRRLQDIDTLEDLTAYQRSLKRILM